MNAARPDQRVAFLTERADYFGGGQRSLRDLAAALLATRFRPLVILPAEGPMTADLDAAGVGWLPLRLPPVRRAPGPAAFGALRGLARALRRGSIALLHTDSPRTAFYGGMASRLGGIPHVWHLRASRPASALSDRILLGLSDAVIAVSHAAGRRSHALRTSDKVRVVHTGIPEPRLLDRAQARRALGLPEKLFVAGIIGRVEPDKGGDDALSALPLIRRAVPGALLAFVGEADPITPWANTLRLRAAAAGLSDAVLFLGQRHDAADLMQAFDLLLHPSRHEALPRVVLEAMAASVPVVATAVGGVPEILDSGRTGLLVPPGDAGLFARAAARLAADPALGARLTGAARREVGERFSMAAMMRGVTAVYEEILVRSRSAPRSAPAREALR